MDTQDHLGRGVAMSAGHLTVAMRVELGRLLAASRGDKREAPAAGFLNCIPAKSSTPRRRPNWQRSWRCSSPRRTDTSTWKLAHRASTYFQALSVDFDFLQPCGSGHCQCHQLTHLAV